VTVRGQDNAREWVRSTLPPSAVPAWPRFGTDKGGLPQTWASLHDLWAWNDEYRVPDGKGVEVDLDAQIHIIVLLYA
jgi:hypothetical protein